MLIEKIIKKLGYFTQEDISKTYIDAYRDGYTDGMMYVARDHVSHAHNIHGMEASDWCDNMYNYLSESLKEATENRSR